MKDYTGKEPTREELTKMLMQTTPPMGHEDWFEVFASCKVWGLDEDTVDQWCSKGDGYDHAQNKAQWNAISVDGDIGKGTLVKFLKDNGVWQDQTAEPWKYTQNRNKERGVVFTADMHGEARAKRQAEARAEAEARAKRKAEEEKTSQAKRSVALSRLARELEEAKTGATRPVAVAYLRSRGIEDTEIDRLTLASGKDYRGAWIDIFYPDRPFKIRRYTSIDPNGKYGDKELKYVYPKDLSGTDRHVFNTPILETVKDGQTVGVVEGIIDALSLTQNGIPSVATGNSPKSLLAELKALEDKGTPFKGVFVCIPDNDEEHEAGTQIAERNCTAIRGEKYPCYIVTLPSEYHDPNDFLRKGKPDFWEWCRELPNTVAELYRQDQEEAEAEAEADSQRYEAEYSSNTALADLMAYRKNPTAHINTGISAIDNALDGGIFEGLYCFSAVSSIGKTALLMQIAENVAEQGKDVLVIALEMAKRELVARALSRISAEKSNLTNCKGLYQIYNAEDDYIAPEVTHYATKIAPHLYIIEANGSFTVEDLEIAVNRHTKSKGTPPIVLLDYLQNLSPIDENYSDKQNMDTSVKRLKQISREHNNTPILVISSVNRAGYNKEATLESAKESGGIEFTADVVAQITFHNMRNCKYFPSSGTYDFSKTEELQKEKERGYREADFSVLKNRHGKTGEVANIMMYPKYFYWRGYPKNIKPTPIQDRKRRPEEPPKENAILSSGLQAELKKQNTDPEEW